MNEKDIHKIANALERTHAEVKDLLKNIDDSDDDKPKWEELSESEETKESES